MLIQPAVWLSMRTRTFHLLSGWVIGAGWQRPEWVRCKTFQRYALRRRCYSFPIQKLTPAGYSHLCGLFLDDPHPNIDFKKVFRFAPELNAHHLKQACHWCSRCNELETEGFIEYLRSQQLTSNVELGEVAEVNLDSLKGVDDVIKSLEANIVLPLENSRPESLLAHGLYARRRG